MADTIFTGYDYLWTRKPNKRIYPAISDWGVQDLHTVAPLQAEHFLHEFGEKATDLDEMSANLRKNPEDTLQFGKMMKR